MRQQPSLDDRIAEAERQVQRWSEEDRRSIRLQGTDDFQERMRLAATAQDRRAADQDPAACTDTEKPKA